MHTDVQLQRHVLDELDWEPSVDASRIGVTVQDGIITLTGHVPTFGIKLTSEQVAKRVHGVRAVANELVVVPEDAHLRDDTEIAAAAAHAVEWNAGVPHDRVQVTVRDGHLVLTGSVEWQYQRAAAARAVENLVGIREVDNQIVVQPTEFDAELAAESFAGDALAAIEAAIRRSARLDSQKVHVELEGNTATLTGDVHSHAELEEAERIAWAARGVTRVENCLTITPWGSGCMEEWGY